ncbi:MAG: histidine kinase [Chloroflexota bacterium]
MTRLRSLPVQLLLFTILPLTVVLMAIALAGLNLHQQAMRQMVGERDERATRAAAAAMTEQLYLKGALVQNLALNARHVDPEVALADSAAFRDEFSSLALFGPGGELLAAEDTGWWTAFHPLLSTELRQMAEAGDTSDHSPVFLPIRSDDENGSPIMIVMAGTSDGLVAAGTFDPRIIARTVLSRVILPGDHTIAYVYNKDGNLLYQIGEPIHANREGDHPGVAEALRGEMGTAFLPSGSDEHVITYTPVNPVGWGLVMEESWQEMTDPMLRRTELAPFILLPVLAIALAGFWFGARQIVRPLQVLAARTSAVGRGDFDAVGDPVGGISEIRILQGELAGMARRLAMAQKGLRDYLGTLTIGQEEERQRLARELHDETIQSLIALNQHIQMARSDAVDDSAMAQLAEMETLTLAAIADLRQMIRDLRPSYLDDLGLVPTLQLLARDQTRASEIHIDYATSGEPRRLSPDIELAFYRIAQEAVRNAVRHSQATGITIRLNFTENQTTLEVIDKGIGFDADERLAELALSGHFGLLGARERAESVGARFAVNSYPGKGTVVSVIYSR